MIQHLPSPPLSRSNFYLFISTLCRTERQSELNCKILCGVKYGNNQYTVALYNAYILIGYQTLRARARAHTHTHTYTHARAHTRSHTEQSDREKEQEAWRVLTFFCTVPVLSRSLDGQSMIPVQNRVPTQVCTHTTTSGSIGLASDGILTSCQLLLIHRCVGLFTQQQSTNKSTEIASDGSSSFRQQVSTRATIINRRINGVS